MGERVRKMNDVLSSIAISVMDKKRSSGSRFLMLPEEIRELITSFASSKDKWIKVSLLLVCKKLFESRVVGLRYLKSMSGVYINDLSNPSQPWYFHWLRKNKRCSSLLSLEIYVGYLVCVMCNVETVYYYPSFDYGTRTLRIIIQTMCKRCNEFSGLTMQVSCYLMRYALPYE